MFGDMPGDATKDQLAKAGMPIGPHHQEVGIKVGGTRKNLVANTDVRAMELRTPACCRDGRAARQWMCQERACLRHRRVP